MRIVTHILLVALALLLSAHIIPGVEVGGLYVAVISAFILGLLNLVVRPILLVLTLPINILTFGLFTFVLNAALVLFAASFIDNFTVGGFWSALMVSLFVSLASTISSRLYE